MKDSDEQTGFYDQTNRIKLETKIFLIAESVALRLRYRELFGVEDIPTARIGPYTRTITTESFIQQIWITEWC